MSERDIYGKAKSQMRLFERIVGELPGFRGYKEKELRRESDRLLRNHLYGKLSEARDNLKQAYQKLADRRRFDVMSDADRLLAKFDRTAEKVNHASYGYAGFFNVVKIEEEGLDRMIQFDNELFDDVDKIVEATAGFKADVAAQKFDTAAGWIQSLTGAIEALEKAFDKREETILGVS